ncbi:Gfo/Idh/MocA family protein [Actinoallomurus iriomotensis]|uniref:Oxidoreductase n=1 Tax=Actinoallomurus iriomotensis TaxID=478107 RepID=A0A9W6RSZ3_9ACTN|nr:Gfo/Idh/MocA family oxidoreductase [Actinoallomurus iriomotensis]GLY81986.1 oxidoreductase [Actinoallomurus iriomotensis]
MTDAARPLRVAMIGHGFMGAAHAHAWHAAPRFFDLPRRIETVAVAGRNPQTLRESADRFGWAECDTDWRRVVERDDIDLVDVVTPGSTHAEVAVAALEAGKHVLCEKPLANTVAEAEAMAEAAVKAAERGVFAMVGFTYRRVPAVSLAREMIESGAIGTIRQTRAVYLQDWLSDENAPLTWRLDRASAGSGALGDIGAHIVDAIQYVTGQEVTGVSGLTHTFVTERPVLTESVGLSGRASDSRRGPVTVDDAAVFLGALSGGALATFEATRMATGRKNALRFEISGTTGSLAFDLEDLNTLQHYRADDGPTAGFRRILVTEPEHPYVAAWWPPGHLLGYEHGFTHQVRDLVTAIDAGEQPRPSFDEGLQVQRVLEAVGHSAAADARWTPLT